MFHQHWRSSKCLTFFWFSVKELFSVNLQTEELNGSLTDTGQNITRRKVPFLIFFFLFGVYE